VNVKCSNRNRNRWIIVKLVGKFEIQSNSYQYQDNKNKDKIITKISLALVIDDMVPSSPSKICNVW
jgi:hypothetical protein